MQAGNCDGSSNRDVCNNDCPHPSRAILRCIAIQSLDLDHLARVKKDRAALAEIQVKHEAATEKANEKISLATHLYEMVDAHIRQLGTCTTAVAIVLHRSCT